MYQSFMFKMNYDGTLVSPSAVLMAVFHLFVYPTILPLTSLENVKCGLGKIYKALNAGENLRTPLCRSNKKRVFTDFGKPIRYACVGPQASRNSQTIHDHPSFMDELPTCHWESLLWLLRRAQESFKTIADHKVISHLHHTKNAVPFKTFTTTNPKSTSAKFFGGIAFGTNVFLQCHTDEDFTMSITQVFSKTNPIIYLMVMLLPISTFQHWVCQFLFVQVIIYCSTP
jgi:hypothetical protein